MLSPRFVYSLARYWRCYLLLIFGSSLSFLLIYISQNDPRLHFGLGAEARMGEVEIKWPSGKVEVLRDLPADFIYSIVEGQGIEGKIALPPLSPSK